MLPDTPFHAIELPDPNIPSSLNPYVGYHNYSTNPFHGGRMPFGIGSILMQMFGTRMWPIPQPGTSQGQFDAVWQRQHDMEMMQMARKTVSSWFPFQNMGGLNENSIITQLATSLLSQPDGLAAAIMSPILGGNPIQAQMASYANLQGVGAAGIGKIAGVSGGEIRAAAENFERYFYNQSLHPINQKEGAQLQDAITTRIKSANLLKLSDQDIQSGFDNFHQLVPGSTAYNRVFNARNAINDVQNKIKSGGGLAEILGVVPTEIERDQTFKNELLNGGISIAAANKSAQGFRIPGKSEGLEIFKQYIGDDVQDTAKKEIVNKIYEARKAGKSKEEIHKLIDEMGTQGLSDTAVSAYKNQVTRGIAQAEGKEYVKKLGGNFEKQEERAAALFEARRQDESVMAPRDPQIEKRDNEIANKLVEAKKAGKSKTELYGIIDDQKLNEDQTAQLKKKLDIGWEKAEKGDNIGFMAEEIKNSVKDVYVNTKEERMEIMRGDLTALTKGNEFKGVSSDALNKLINRLAEMEGGGASKAEMLKEVELIKLDPKAAEIVKKGVEEASVKLGKVVGDAVGVKLQKKPIDETAEGMKAAANMMLYQKVTRGVNYEHTMGFNYEDLLGARDEMIKNRLVSGNLNKLSEVFGGAEGAYMPHLLDAMRSAFGNEKTGKQLVQDVNKFIGYSNYNLKNPEGAKRLENDLRNLRAASRITNIDYNTIMSFENQAMNAASMNPLTAHLGGKELAPLALKTAINTAVMSSVLKDEEVRYMGGTENMYRNAMEGAIESAQQPVATQLAAMHTYFKTTNNKKGMQLIENYVKDWPRSDMSASGWQNFQEKLGSEAKVNLVDLQNFSQYNPAATSQGYQDVPEIMQAGGMAEVDAYLQGVELYNADQFKGSGAAKGAAGVSARMVAEQLIKQGRFNELRTDPRFASGEFGIKVDELLKKHYLYNYAVQMDPDSEFAVNAKKMGERMEDSKKLDEIVSYSMARMNAPTIQRFMQSIISGKAEGLDSIMESLGLSKKSQVFADITDDSNRLQKLTDATSIEDIFNITEKGKKAGEFNGSDISDAQAVSKFSKLANTYNITTTDIGNIANVDGADNKTDEQVLKQIRSEKLTSEYKTEAGKKKLKEIRGLATQVQSAMKSNGALFNFHGDIRNIEDIREFFSQPVKGRLIDNLSGIKESRNRLDADLTSVAADLEKFGISDDDKKFGKIVSTLINKSGARETFKILEDIRNQGIAGTAYEEEVDDKGKPILDKNGKKKYKLSQSYAAVSQAQGLMQTSGLLETEAQAAVKKIFDAQEASPEIKGRVVSNRDLETQREKLAEGDPTMNMAKEVKSISEAMKPLTAAIQAIATELGKPH
jgi:hypothetical protein